MPNRQLLEIAIDLLVQLARKERAGEGGPAFSAFYNNQVQPAVKAAMAAGWSHQDIHGGADRRYGQWLIANAGQ